MTGTTADNALVNVLIAGTTFRHGDKAYLSEEMYREIIARVKQHVDSIVDEFGVDRVVLHCGAAPGADHTMIRISQHYSKNLQCVAHSPIDVYTDENDTPTQSNQRNFVTKAHATFSDTLYDEPSVTLNELRAFGKRPGRTIKVYDGGYEEKNEAMASLANIMIAVTSAKGGPDNDPYPNGGTAKMWRETKAATKIYIDLNDIVASAPGAISAHWLPGLSAQGLFSGASVAGLRRRGDTLGSVWWRQLLLRARVYHPNASTDELRQRAHVQMVRKMVSALRLSQDEPNQFADARVSADAMRTRGLFHDASKFSDPEEAGYMRWSTLTDDERAAIIQAHYKNNDHHPEHFVYPDGGMHPEALVEMVCDWFALAAEHNDHELNWIEREFVSPDGRFGKIFKEGGRARPVIAAAIDRLRYTMRLFEPQDDDDQAKLPAKKARV